MSEPQLDEQTRKHLIEKLGIPPEAIDDALTQTKEIKVILGDMIKELDRIFLNAEKQAAGLKHPPLIAKSLILDRLKRNIYQREHEFIEEIVTKAQILDHIAK